MSDDNSNAAPGAAHFFKPYALLMVSREFLFYPTPFGQDSESNIDFL